MPLENARGRSDWPSGSKGELSSPHWGLLSTAASIELVPTAAVTVSFRSAASALLSTVVAGIVELEFSSTASVAANDVDVRLRRAPIQRRRWRRALIAMTEQPVFGGSPQMFFWSAAATRSIDEAMAVRSMFIVVTCLMRT